jgi:hypothetical protein
MSLPHGLSGFTSPSPRHFLRFQRIFVPFNAVDPVRIVVIERVQQDRIDDTEYRRTGPDAERQRHDRRCREGQVLAQQAPRVAEIPEKDAAHRSTPCPL